jgi:hypothetical protein
MVTSQPLIMADPELLTPPNQQLWTTPRMLDERRMWPTYSPHEVAHCFFGFTTAWLRKHLQSGKHITQQWGEIEPPRTESGRMQFRLYDVERLAYSFFENNVITGQRLGQVVHLVKIHAQMHRFM